jgi:hypothetical protein
MFCNRRGLRGVLVAAAFLILTASSPAQHAFRRNNTNVPVPNASKSSPTADCDVSDAILPRASRTSTTSLTESDCSSPSMDVRSSPVSVKRPPSALLAEPNFATLGKRGRSVLVIRGKVLDLLNSQNSCSEWFRGASLNPAGTFKTLSFVLDSKAVDYVIESVDAGLAEAYINPYVATVVQDGGDYQIVTLNVGGAFFQASANLVRLPKEGGPVQFRGARMLRVGPYLGNTPQAQMTTLLHELGHVVNLLPLDTHDANGRSAANTAEVLRHCQSQIEAAAKQPDPPISR